MSTKYVSEISVLGIWREMETSGPPTPSQGSPLLLLAIQKNILQSATVVYVM
jgi:hypothetical protein